MVFNATFNNISVISWRSVSLIEEIKLVSGKEEIKLVSGKNFIKLSYKILSSTEQNSYVMVMVISTDSTEYM